MTPRLLDLFCGAGGAAVGYARAGFEVVGVDIEPQPYFPFEFHQADALTFPTAGYDAIHASPPCQGFTTMSNRYPDTQAAHPRWIEASRAICLAAGVPYVIENVVGAARHLRTTLLLEGGMFGLGVHRPRLFESNVAMFSPGPGSHGDLMIGVYGARPDGRRLNTRSDGSIQRCAASLAEAQDAMGMDWADWHGTKEAIPPAYTEWIGAQLIASLDFAAAGVGT